MINIVKSQPAPLCLSVEREKAYGDYKCGEVIKRLIEDFHNKCYICEEKEPSTINVEHLKPHREDKHLKFDWNNLFLSCGHCNNVKLAKYDNIIDCTDSTRNILELIRFEIKPFPKEKAYITALSSDNDVINTTNLLNEVYNGTTNLKRFEGINIRNKLIRELISFQGILHDYFDEPGLSIPDKTDLKNKIKRRLSPKAPFTAFKIWVIKNNDELFEEFGSLIVPQY